MPSFKNMTAAAAEWAEHFEPNRLTASPVRHVLVLACMDARLDLFRLLGLEVGDAHIVRNAGGRATEDAIRSIVLSMHALGTREVVIIHHTGCGLHAVTNEQLRELVGNATGHVPDEIDFRPFDDVVQSVRDDVAIVKACKYLPEGISVWGAVYDVDTGVLAPVDRTS
jgi:carbonic anhydrase